MAVSATPERCSRCGAAFVAEDRFCSTCGASRGSRTAGKVPQHRGVWLTAVMSVVLVAVLGIAAAIYFTAPERRAEAPLARLAIQGRPVLAIDPGPPMNVFVGSGDHLLVSQDQGATWRTDATVGAVAAIGVAPSEPHSTFLAGSSLWQVDRGKVASIKTSLTSGDVLAIAVDPDDSRRLDAITQHQGLERSDDGGATWSPVGGSLPSDANCLVVGNSGLARIFVGTAAHGVFDSADGQLWSNASGFVNGALPTRNISAVAFDPRSGDQYVGPSGETASGALYVGTDVGIFKSIDTGLSWSALSFHHPAVALAVTTDGSHLMLAVDPNGDVYRSRDGGHTWQ